MSFYGNPCWNYGHQGATQNAFFYGVHNPSTFQPAPAPYAGGTRNIGGSLYNDVELADSFYTNNNTNNGTGSVLGDISPQPVSSAAAGLSTAAEQSSSSDTTYYNDDVFAPTTNGGAVDQISAADVVNARDTPPPLQRKNSSGRLLRRKVSFSGVPSTLPPEVEPRTETTTLKRLGTRRLSSVSAEAAGKNSSTYVDSQQQLLYPGQQLQFCQQQFPQSRPFDFPPQQQEQQLQQEAEAVSPQQLLFEEPQEEQSSQSHDWEQQQHQLYNQQTLQFPYGARQQLPSYSSHQQERQQEQQFFLSQQPQQVTDLQQIQFAAQSQAPEQELQSQTYSDAQQQQQDLPAYSLRQQQEEENYQRHILFQLQPTLATGGSVHRSNLGSLSLRNSQMRMFCIGRPMNRFAADIQSFGMMPFPSRSVYRPMLNLYRSVPYGVYNVNVAAYQRQTMPNYY